MKENTNKITRKKGRPENLMPPWKPGQSGNLKGHPKGLRNRATIAKKVLDMAGMMPDEVLNKLKKMFPEMEHRLCIEEIMTLMQAHKAITKADYYAYVALMDSGYGKASQPLTGKDGKDLYNKNPYDGLDLEDLRAEKAKRLK